MHKHVQTHSTGFVDAVQVDAIVFLVDAADPERFTEAKKELDALLSEDHLSKVRASRFQGLIVACLCLNLDQLRHLYSAR